MENEISNTESLTKLYVEAELKKIIWNILKNQDNILIDKFPRGMSLPKDITESLDEKESLENNYVKLREYCNPRVMKFIIKKAAEEYEFKLKKDTSLSYTRKDLQNLNKNIRIAKDTIRYLENMFKTTKISNKYLPY